jgi:hypothetical protein
LQPGKKEEERERERHGSGWRGGAGDKILFPKVMPHPKDSFPSSRFYFLNFCHFPIAYQIMKPSMD